MCCAQRRRSGRRVSRRGRVARQLRVRGPEAPEGGDSRRNAEVSTVLGYPKWMVYKENPTKMDDLGVILLQETTV